MDQQTERMIRNDIRLRWGPAAILLFAFLGSVAGFALIGTIVYLEHYLGGVR